MISSGRFARSSTPPEHKEVARPPPVVECLTGSKISSIPLQNFNAFSTGTAYDVITFKFQISKLPQVAPPPPGACVSVFSYKCVIVILTIPNLIELMHFCVLLTCSLSKLFHSRCPKTERYHVYARATRQVCCPGFTGSVITGCPICKLTTLENFQQNKLVCSIENQVDFISDTLDFLSGGCVCWLSLTVLFTAMRTAQSGFSWLP